MKRMVCTALALGGLLAATGCANVSMVAHQSARTGVFFGSVGVKGNGNTVTVENRSRLTELSIWGDDNTVTVEDDVTLPKVEFFGSNNTVSIPGHLWVRVTEWGNGNKLIRRQVRWELPAEGETEYGLPPTHPATAPGSPERATPPEKKPVKPPTEQPGAPTKEAQPTEPPVEPEP